MNKQKVIVISSYPSKEHIHDSYVGGVASYAKNTLLSIKKIKESTKLDITVLADRVNQHTDYIQKNIRVKRIWKKSSPVTFIRLAKEIFFKEHTAKSVIIEFEHQMFGGPLNLLPLPFFVMALRLSGKRVIVVCHQVIPDMNEIGPHINVQIKSSKAVIMNIMLGLFYRLLLISCSKIIVFEDNLKQRLGKYGNKKKIVTIAHGVQQFPAKPTMFEARKNLGILEDKFVILLFGFIGWYKGTDWAIDAIKKIKNEKKNKNFELIIAGGPNPNLEEKKHYAQYIQNIKDHCLENGIRITGFVAEKDIPLYYSAADLVVFPYRSFMSASGPLSLAMSFGKPFLLSPKLKPVIGMKDFQTEMKKLRIKEEDMHFTDFNGDFSKKLSRLEKNMQLRERISMLSTKIQKKRSWDIIGTQYYNEIVNQ